MPGKLHDCSKVARVTLWRRHRPLTAFVPRLMARRSPPTSPAKPDFLMQTTPWHASSRARNVVLLGPPPTYLQHYRLACSGPRDFHPQAKLFPSTAKSLGQARTAEDGKLPLGGIMENLAQRRFWCKAHFTCGKKSAAIEVSPYLLHDVRDLQRARDSAAMVWAGRGFIV
jgi:hypothetical protein